MNTQWLAMEHYRLHVVEQWPDGPHKEAALTAVRSTIESLTSRAPSDAALVCSICSARAQARQVVEFRCRSVQPSERAA
jgi:hypothetical protein